MASPRVRFPRDILWKLFVKPAHKHINLRSTQNVSTLRKYTQVELPLSSPIKLSKTLICLHIEDTRQMACNQPNIIFQAAHPHTFW